MSMEQTRERLSRAMFVNPRLKHASPLALTLSSEAQSLSEEVVLQKDVVKELKFELTSTDRIVQLELAAANKTIKRLTAENISNQLRFTARLTAQDERIRQLSQPRKDINAVHANIRREYARMEMEAQELMTVLPHNMATIKELCHRCGVIFLPHHLCQLLKSVIAAISRSCDVDFLTPFYKFLKYLLFYVAVNLFIYKLRLLYIYIYKLV